MRRFWILLTILATVLAACSSSDADPTPTPQQDSNEESTSTAEPASDDPTQAPTTAESETATPESTATPTPDPTPETDDDGDNGSGQEVEVAIIEPDASDPPGWTYDPEEVVVQAGDTIVWTNDGGAAHTVTSEEDASFEFDSGTMESDETFSLEIPDEAGEHVYFCTFHPWMEATFIVEE